MKNESEKKATQELHPQVEGDLEYNSSWTSTVQD
jgi:hypothetical protein